MSSKFARIIPAAAFALVAGAFAGCNEEEEVPLADSFPPLAVGDNYCEPGTTKHEDFATWLRAANEFSVGTITSVTPVWGTYYDEAGVLVENCNAAYPALDVTLNDVKSLINGREFQSITLRLSPQTLQAWDQAGYDIGAFETPTISWSKPSERPEPLQIGSTLIAASYKVGDTNLVVAHLEPLMTVDDKGRVLVQEVKFTSCADVGLTVGEVMMGLNGITLEDLEKRADLAAYVDFPDDDPTLYRAHIGVDNSAQALVMTNSICVGFPSEEEPIVDPDEDGGDGGDTEPGDGGGGDGGENGGDADPA